jgi:hypothetical protein
MKLIGAAFCVAGMCAAGLGAQTSQTETKSKITVKDGQEVTVTGCVQPMASETGFMLTNVADKSGALRSYMLVTDEMDLAKHVGHRVMINGKAADRGEGKIETETTTKIKMEHGADKEIHGKSEVSGDLANLPYLGVKSVKMIAASCP